MKNTTLIFFLIVYGIALGQTKEISGIIVAKSDGLPLPGANVHIKGTKIHTSTDFNGNFSLNVDNPNAVLVFSYLGFISKEVKPKGRDKIKVKLKEDCTKCWFDTQRIGFYGQSGILNTPIGGQFKFTFPDFLMNTTVKSSISYQTDLKHNRILEFDLQLDHLFVSCDLDIDFHISYRGLDFERSLELSAYTIETNLNFRRITAILGYSQADFSNSTENKKVKASGVTLGLGTWIGRPFMMSVKAKTNIYNKLSEYEVEINKQYKNLYGFIKFYRVNAFNELSIGLGYEFTYLFRSQRPQEERTTE